MPPRDRRYRLSGLLGLEHDRAFFFGAEAAAACSTGVAGTPDAVFVKLDSTDGTLAPTSALVLKTGAGARMKHRPPIDDFLAALQKIAPFARQSGEMRSAFA